MTLPQKNDHRIKIPSSKLTILMASCSEKNSIRTTAHNFFILSLVFLKLLIKIVAFFLGHPVYRVIILFMNVQYHKHTINAPPSSPTPHPHSFPLYPINSLLCSLPSPLSPARHPHLLLSLTPSPLPPLLTTLSLSPTSFPLRIIIIILSQYDLRMCLSCH